MQMVNKRIFAWYLVFENLLIKDEMYKSMLVARPGAGI